MTRHPGPSLHLRGLSLIELLVALALSLFLIAGLVAMYVSTRRSYNIQQQSAALQGKERLTATFVGSVVQSAGFYAAPQTYTPYTAFPVNGTFATVAQVFYGTSASTGGNYADTLSIRFLTAPKDGVLNCLGYGNNGTTTQLYVNRFSLDTQNDELECILSGPGLTTQKQPLLSGVTSLHFLYGVDTNGDGSADVYAPADAIGASQWNAVRSIEIILKFATRQAATGRAGTQGTPVTFRATFPVRTSPL